MSAPMDIPERSEDLGPGYSSYRDDMETVAAIERMRALADVPPTAAPEPELEAAAPEKMTLTQALMRNANLEFEGVKTLGRAAKATAKDVARGVIEIPRALAGGILQDIPEGIQGTLDDLSRVVIETLTSDEEFAAAILEGAQASRPDLIPEIDRPKSVTGNITRELASFATLFVPVLGQIEKATGAPGKIGKIAQIAGASGLAEFVLAPEVDENLSGFLDENPDLREPVEAFLAAEEGSGFEKIEARLRSALVVAGLGAAAESGLAFFRLLREARKARKLVQQTGKAAAATTEAAEALPEVAAEAVSIGNPRARRFKVSEPNADKLAATEELVQRRLGENATPAEIKRQAAIEGTRVEINMARINTDDDVKTLMQEVTDVFGQSIDQARRGVRSNEATEDAARQLGISLDGLLSRRGGQALNAEESLAFRHIHASAAEQLEALARKAAAPNAGDVDRFKFRRALVVFQAINQQVLGARAEAGRALQAWAIPAKGNAERFSRMLQVLDQSGAGEVAEELAKQVVRAADSGFSPGQLSRMVGRGAVARTLDAVRESYTAGLLWSPATHIVNIAGNTIVAGQQILERAIAARIPMAAAEVGSQGVAPGEALAMMHGLMAGIRTTFRIGSPAGEAAAREALAGFSKIDLARPRALSSAALEIGSDTGLGRFVDFWGWMTRGSFAGLQLSDDFFKGIGFQMQSHALSYRKAFASGGTREEIAARMVRILDDLPEDIHMASVDFATYSTFTNKPGELAKAVMKLRDGGAIPFLFVLTPYIKTPANIMRYSFERTPIAPLMAGFRADVAAGGSRQQIALARMATGTALSMWMADLAFQGHVTGAGPEDPGVREALMRSGWQPFSIRVGDRYYRYNRLDPFGMLAGVSASMSETMRGFEADGQHESTLGEIGAGMVAATSQTVMDKAYLTGVSNLMRAIEEPERFGPAFVERTLAAFVPFSSALRTAARASDPALADPTGAWETVQAMIPGLQAQLPRRRDLWGDALTAQEVYGRIFDVVSPVRVTEWKPSPIDAEIVKHQMDIRRIRRIGSFDGVSVNFRDFPRVYEAYVMLAGNDLKHPVTQKGARDFLSETVQGRGDFSDLYSNKTDGPEGTKLDFIRSWISRYRKLAMREIMDDPNGRYRADEFQRFRSYVELERERDREEKLKALQ